MLEAIRDLGKLPPVKRLEKSPDVRACNIKAEEHSSFIDWNNWHIERIWYLLRGTCDWLNAIEKLETLFTIKER